MGAKYMWANRERENIKKRKVRQSRVGRNNRIG